MQAVNSPTFHGARLRLARIFQGLTLEELGKQILATRQYIQRIESDPASSPNADFVAALAEILHVQRSFFFEPLKAELQEDLCHFRKLKTTPIHIRKRALAYGTIFNILVSYLDTQLQMPSINIPISNANTRTDIERASENCRKTWKMGMDSPVHCMVRTLEHAGAVVTTFEGISASIDAFSYIYSRPIVVRNTAKVSSSRARFDLAHELGHLVLHQGIEAEVPFLEDQANQFASSFLLPRVAFLREFPRLNRIDWYELTQMKIRWGVSIQAIMRRAYDLEIINAVQYRNAHIYISRQGWKTCEPGEDYIPFEHPEIIPTALQILSEHGKTLEHIADAMHVNPEIIELFVGATTAEKGLPCQKKSKPLRALHQKRPNSSQTPTPPKM